MNIEKEFEANYFAFALLMPEKEFRLIVNKNTDKNGKVNLKEISQYFGVTISDVHYRGVDLGLFETKEDESVEE